MTEDSKTPEQMAEEYAEDLYKDSDYPKEILVYTKKATAAVFLAGYQAATPQWISVKERLPDNGDCVLVYRNHIAEISIALALFDYWQKWGVTHWMALPEAPE